MFSIKKVSVIVIFILSSLCFMAGMAAAGEKIEENKPAVSAAGGPRIEFEKVTHDFGTVDQQTAHDVIFKFKNAGDKDLTIFEVKPTCGCTAALLSSKVTVPGGVGEIKVTFNSGAFKGHVTKTVNIESNDSIKPVTGLQFTANVKYDPVKEKALQEAAQIAREKAMKESKEKAAKTAGPFIQQNPGAVPLQPAGGITATVTPPPAPPANIDYNPKKIELGNIKLGTPYTKTVKITTATKDKPISIKKVEIYIPYVSAMINSLGISPENPGEIDITVNAKKTSNLKSGILYVHINGENKILEIPISWDVK